MTNVFLFGTLCWPDLLHRVGGKTCPEGQAAVLNGFQVSWAKGHGFPAIHQVTGSVAHGMVLRGCDAAVLNRLDHYESGFGYSLHPVEVQESDGPLQAQVYLPPDGISAGEVWNLADWVRDYGALAYEASL